MRLVALLAVVLILAPAASAATGAPVGLSGLGGIRIVKLKQEHQQKSCSVQRKTHRAVGKVARRVKPVACEQPPRSKVFDAGYVIVLAP
jgi:hypothetical protein